MNIFRFDTQFILTITYKYKEKFMSQFKIVDHSKNQIYKQFEDSLYGYDTVPEGYELLFERNNEESGFSGKVYIKDNHIVVATEGTEIEKLNDLFNDYALMVRKHVPAQFYDYLDIYKTINNLKVINPNIKTTWLGYSLTGNPAQMLGVLSGEETICFAPLGAGNTIKHLDKIYNNSSELQKLFPNYRGYENADTSNITNYCCIDDTFANLGGAKMQIGSIFIVPQVDGMLPHYLYNWGYLVDSVPLDEMIKLEIFPTYYLNKSKDKLYGYVESSYNNFYDKLHNVKDKIFTNHHIPTGYATDISKCTGSYPVSGYTRSDGTKVSGYTRNCYKHSGQRIPRLTDMSKDEMEWWLAKLI